MNIFQERLIFAYVEAMDKGDMEIIADILEIALYDPELFRIITEIDLVIEEEIIGEKNERPFKLP